MDMEKVMDFIGDQDPYEILELVMGMLSDEQTVELAEYLGYEEE